MNKTIEFVKTTLIGGLLVVLPAAVILALVVRAMAAVRNAVNPIMSWLPDNVFLPGFIALLIVMGGCFLVGLVVRTAIGQRLNQAMERAVLERIPGYALLRSLTRRFAGEEEGIAFKVALVEIENALVPAFLVERHEDGSYTVFVPAVPTPTVGSLYIMRRELVHPVDIPFAKAVASISRWGVGSGELLRGIRRAQPDAV